MGRTTGAARGAKHQVLKFIFRILDLFRISDIVLRT
jgi:hypothetical protein